MIQPGGGEEIFRSTYWILSMERSRALLIEKLHAQSAEPLEDRQEPGDLTLVWADR